MKNITLPPEINQGLIDTHKKGIELIIEQIHQLGIPVIKAVSVRSSSFLVQVDKIDSIDKSLITEGSLATYFIEPYEIDEYSDIPVFYNGIEEAIHIYIRIGLTDTLLYIKAPTVLSVFRGIFHKCEPEIYDDEDADSNEIDYERLNKLSTIVAKSDGFNALKNREQRSIFAKEILSGAGEKFGDHELYGIAANSETFYDLGVLPIRAQELKGKGISIQQIAKELGHTKAKIEKALRHQVSDVIRKNIEQYDKEHSLIN